LGFGFLRRDRKGVRVLGFGFLRRDRKRARDLLKEPALFEGVFSVLPTPFHEDGSLDLDSMRRVIDLFITGGVNGLTALGVTGEVARLTERERQTVLECVIQHVNGRVPVVAGTSADGAHLCLEYSLNAKQAGASAVMISPPRMAKLNSEAVVRHYAAVATTVNIEIIVQDFPPITGFTMEPSLLARIAREIPQARTIKLEDPPTPFKTSRILEESKDVPVKIFGGLGGVFLLEELMAGATGAMTGFAYPEILVDIVKAFRGGDSKRAEDLFYCSVPLMRFEFQEGIGMAIRKEVLKRRGALTTSIIRSPGTRLDAPTLAALDRVLKWTGKA
jgi:4-hydroxy-tetrahydrodipicolinate synthase